MNGLSAAQFPSQAQITPASINSISNTRHVAGSMGSYQAKAIGAMKMSGRSPSFMAQNLNQATANQMPNWGLSSSQASIARPMVASGRSQSFIRGKLGLPSTTPVPGKMG